MGGLVEDGTVAGLSKAALRKSDAARCVSGMVAVSRTRPRAVVYELGGANLATISDSQHGIYVGCFSVHRFLELTARLIGTVPPRSVSDHSLSFDLCVVTLVANPHSTLFNYTLL